MVSDFDDWIVRVLRSFGGMWDQWEDQLTVDRYSAIIRAEKEIPPVYVTAYLVGAALGIKWDSVLGRKPEGAVTSGIDFVSTFGMSGTLNGSM